jgi:hypothetical protein
MQRYPACVAGRKSVDEVASVVKEDDATRSSAFGGPEGEEMTGGEVHMLFKVALPQGGIDRKRLESGGLRCRCVRGPLQLAVSCKFNAQAFDPKEATATWRCDRIAEFLSPTAVKLRMRL